MLGLLRRQIASDCDDRFVVGLAVAFAAGDGSDREGLLRGKNPRLGQSHSSNVRLSLQGSCFVQTVHIPSTSFSTVICVIVIGFIEQLVAYIAFINSPSPLLSKQNPLVEPVSLSRKKSSLFCLPCDAE